MRYSLNFVFATGLGLFGLSTFSTERRIKEIGIRKIFDASVSNTNKFYRIASVNVLVSHVLRPFCRLAG
jgi:hypothetical protein